MRLAVLLRILGILLLATLTLGSLALGGASPGAGGRPASSFGMPDALAFATFPLFDAGDRVDGLPRTAVLRRDDAADFVSFVYGDCTPRDEGCAPPVEIQVWPACRRNLHLDGSDRPSTPTPERTIVRGVPAAWFEDGLRLELQASTSTIVVFGDSRARVRRVAAALRSLGKPLSDSLPSPPSGAVEGKSSC